MQTILGSGGAIGTELARALRIYTTDIRLVSRNPVKVDKNDQVFAADLRVKEEVFKAVQGASVAYLTVGLAYDHKIWQRDWPLIMENVIEACLKHQTKLVFFDNIYMYEGSHLNQIMETHKIAPPSKKGLVRAQLTKQLWRSVKEKGLEALIARSADFYGPNLKNSLLGELVIHPLRQGKTASWLVSDRFKHSFTYTVDAASATALLGNRKEAYGHSWHLPTAKNPPSGSEWIQMVAGELGVRPRKRILGKKLVSALGLFKPMIKETAEMLYQYDKDYVFNSDKFEKHFAFQPTSYEDGIKEVLRSSIA